MLAFSIDYYGIFFRATQSVELFCAYSFSAGSSNKVKVDLVHKGTIVQTVVSSWTISAGGSKSHTITADDLGGYSNSDKFYFRFNSSPIGNRYSISGYFG